MPMCYMNYYILVTAVFLKLNKICLKGYTSKRNIAASKEQYKKNTNYFYAVRIRISFAILS